MVDGVVGRQTADWLDMQAGPTNTCIAMGGDSFTNGRCIGESAVGLGKSAWDCIREEAGVDAVVELVKHTTPLGRLITKIAVHEAAAKITTFITVSKCMTWDKPE